MLAYSHPLISRSAFLAEMTEHQDQDKVLQGYYWDGDRGCAIGCSARSILQICPGATIMLSVLDMDIRQLVPYLGIPFDVLLLEDWLFEHLPVDRARLWPLQFGTAVAEGADLSGVAFAFVAAALRTLFISDPEEPPEWVTVAQVIANSMDGRSPKGDPKVVPDGLYLRSLLPDREWNSPKLAVDYMLSAARGEGMVRRDALLAFMHDVIRFARGGPAVLAGLLLQTLAAAPIGMDKAA